MLKIQSTTDAIPKPSINEWMNEFNVSSRYEVKQHPLDAPPFSVDRFKKNIKKGLILTEQAVS